MAWFGNSQLGASHGVGELTTDDRAEIDRMIKDEVGWHSLRTNLFIVVPIIGLIFWIMRGQEKLWRGH